MRRMESDHGSIVAFRIPRPVPRSASTLPLRLPLQLLQPTCTPCNSPPPFVPPPIPRYPPVALTSLAPPRDSHEALDRRACIAGVHASLRRPRPTDQTPDSLLSPSPPPPLSLSPFLLWSSHGSRSRSLFDAAFSPSLSLPRFPGRRVASEGEARGAE